MVDLVPVPHLMVAPHLVPIPHLMVVPHHGRTLCFWKVTRPALQLIRATSSPFLHEGKHYPVSFKKM